MNNLKILLVVPIILLLILLNDSIAQNGEWFLYKAEYKDLPSSKVYSISFDAEGNKWFGTDKGVGKYDGTNWSQYKMSNSGLPDSNILSIAVDKNKDAPGLKLADHKIITSIRNDNNLVDKIKQPLLRCDWIIK